VAFERGLKFKKAEAKKERCVGQEFSRATIEIPKKALEESHHCENCSRAFQIVFSKANAPATWPGLMSRNARVYLAQAGSPTSYSRNRGFPRKRK